MLSGPCQSQGSALTVRYLHEMSRRGREQSWGDGREGGMLGGTGFLSKVMEC